MKSAELKRSKSLNPFQDMFFTVYRNIASIWSIDGGIEPPLFNDIIRFNFNWKTLNKYRLSREGDG